jgi:hypothetical protein
MLTKKVIRQFSNGDPGDSIDKLKWDFDEDINFETIKIDGYDYKVLRNGKDPQRVAEKLHILRQIIDEIADYLREHYDDYSDIPDELDIFLDLHGNDGDNYLLSQIPKKDARFKNKKIDFMGLNKPKDRHMTNEPHVGPDQNMRSGYRDIFLEITPTTCIDKIMPLVLHELAHSGCNHIRWRPDDHGDDFKRFEDVLIKAYNNISK